MSNLVNSFWEVSALPNWNTISGLTSDSVSLDVSSETPTNFYGIDIIPDGTKLYTINISDDKIYQYSGTAWDLSTFSYDSVVSDALTSEDGVPLSIHWKPDGTKLFMCGNADTIFQYSASTPFDPSNTSLSYDSVSLSVSLNAFDMWFKPDGSEVFVLSNTSDTVSVYELPTPWVLTSGAIDSGRTLTIVDPASPNPRGLFFNPNGFQMYIVFLTGELHEYILGTAFDPSTAPNPSTDDINVAGTSPNCESVFFKPDGTKVYTNSRDNDDVHQWSL